MERELNPRARLLRLEREAGRRETFDPRPLARLMHSDPEALEMGFAAADLLFGDGVREPLPQDHPDVRAAFSRLGRRLAELGSEVA